MTTIHHTATNTLIQMDDAALAADVALALDLKRLAQRPHAVALIQDVGATLGAAPEYVKLAISLVREAQKILVHYGDLTAITV